MGALASPPALRRIHLCLLRSETALPADFARGGLCVILIAAPEAGSSAEPANDLDRI